MGNAFWLELLCTLQRAQFSACPATLKSSSAERVQFLANLAPYLTNWVWPGFHAAQLMCVAATSPTYMAREIIPISGRLPRSPWTTFAAQPCSTNEPREALSNAETYAPHDLRDATAWSGMLQITQFWLSDANLLFIELEAT